MPKISSSLIWVQTVCKIYQQATYIYNGLCCAKNLILLHTNDKGTDLTVSLHSLISAFVMHFVENKIANLGTVKISNLQQLSVARRWD